jgi:hypothetical protein
LVVGAAINIVEQPAEIVTELNNTSDAFQTGVGVGEAELGIANRIKKADIYAEAGLWYDALAEVVVIPNNSEAKAFTTKLIEQLTAIEKQNHVNNAQPEVIEIQQQHQQQLAEISADTVGESNQFGFQARYKTD